MSNIPEAANLLTDFKPNRFFFVGIDSDGCAFDAMELKRKAGSDRYPKAVCVSQEIWPYSMVYPEFMELRTNWRVQVVRRNWFDQAKCYTAGKLAKNAKKGENLCLN